MLLGKRTHECIGVGLRRHAHGRQDPDHFVVEPTHREREGITRRRVEPLRVVDRDHDEPLSGEQPEGAERRRSDGVSVDGAIAVRFEEEGGGKRAPLRRWKLRQDVADPVSQQIAQSGIGELCFRAGGPRPENQGVAALRDADAFAPDAGLPDAGVSLEEERLRALRDAVEEQFHCLNLGRPPDERRAHGLRCHGRPGIAQWPSSF
jgi:hypothetical protein